MDKAAEICKAAGIKLAYQSRILNSCQNLTKWIWDFIKMKLIRTLVDFEMDLYWVVRAGYHPLELFKEHLAVTGMLKIWIK
jgi:hypothetical protein